MNYFERINQNPVLLYAAVGAVAGSMLGGSRKEQTNQAVLYGSVGAVVGWFMAKSKEAKTEAIIQRAAATEAAAVATVAAADAQEAAPAGWGEFGRAGRPARATAPCRRARQMLLSQAGVGAIL